MVQSETWRCKEETTLFTSFRAAKIAIDRVDAKTAAIVRCTIWNKNKNCPGMRINSTEV